MSNMPKKRVLIIIDGSNFYNRKKELAIKKHTLNKFNYSRFADWLAEENKIVGRNYYIGVVRAEAGDARGQELRANQQRLFSHLTSPTQKFNVVRGVLMKSDSVYHEKGVDVRMAVDLVVGACEDKYDIAILVSSDTDLVPAINLARRKGKQVVYVGFSHKPTYALQKNSDLSRLITKTELEQFIDP